MELGVMWRVEGTWKNRRVSMGRGFEAARLVKKNSKNDFLTRLFLPAPGCDALDGTLCAGLSGLGLGIRALSVESCACGQVRLAPRHAGKDAGAPQWRRGMRKALLGFLLFALIAVLCLAVNRAAAGTAGQDRAQDEGAEAVQLTTVVSGLSSPLFVANAHDGSQRLFIVEQPGRIQVLQPG